MVETYSEVEAKTNGEVSLNPLTAAAPRASSQNRLRCMMQSAGLIFGVSAGCLLLAG